VQAYGTLSFMSKTRKWVLKVVERTLSARVVRPRDLARLHEQFVLEQFFHDFQVDAVFDVGANSGQYARMIRQRAGYKGPIISFEPIPNLAAALRIEAAADPLGWFVEECALNDKGGEALFNVMNSDRFSSLRAPLPSHVAHVDTLNQVESTVTVRLETLDGIFDDYQGRLGFRRPFLKMDTQGNDLAVATGAGERIERFVGLQSELAFRHLYEGTLHYDEAIAAYEAMGFVLTALFPNNAGHFPDLLEMDCVMYRPDSGH
jgi:FkbM family methyltransferase